MSASTPTKEATQRTPPSAVLRQIAESFREVRSDWLVGAFAIAVIATGLALRLAIAWLDVETLVLKTLPDDAFYYFVTADHISSGEGISFDGLTTTNGYHPLWLFFLVPFWLLPGDAIPLHLALTMSSLLGVLAASLTGLAVWRLTENKVAGLFALTVYLLVPQNVFSSVNGVESSLAAALLAALLLVLVWVWRVKRKDWLRWAAFTGVLSGLAVLARLDSVAVVACLLALVALQQAGRTRWLAPAVSAGIAALMVAPWFVWSWFAIGTPHPTSAESTTWLLRTYFTAANPDADALDKLQHGLTYTKDVFWTRFPGLYLPDRPLDFLIVAAIAALVAHFLLVARGAHQRRSVLVVVLPLAAFVATLLASSVYRWSVREWYFAWGMPFAVAFVGLAFAHLQRLASQALRMIPALRVQRETSRSLLLYVAVVAALIVAYVPSAQDTWRIGLYPGQRQHLVVAAYLKANTQEDERIASFNAGVVSYMSGRTVINIDGVVNGDAYDALRQHLLIEYLHKMDVAYFADADSYLSFLPAFVRPDDWSSSLWGEDPNETFVRLHPIEPGGIYQKSVWRLLR